jgi:hypothetical protein
MLDMETGNKDKAVTENIFPVGVLLGSVRDCQHDCTLQLCGWGRGEQGVD